MRPFGVGVAAARPAETETISPPSVSAEIANPASAASDAAMDGPMRIQRVPVMLHTLPDRCELVVGPQAALSLPALGASRRPAYADRRAGKGLLRADDRDVALASITR